MNKQIPISSKQRSRKGRLEADRIKRLDALGFVWDSLEQAWETRFQELVSYQEEHGDCLVPRSWKNKLLATWVSTQRTTKKKGKLEDDQIKRLDDLGFVWDPIGQFWETQFLELVSYKEEHGDCLVPDKWKENRPLANWIGNQRARKGKLEDDKIYRLDELGFVWNTKNKKSST